MPMSIEELRKRSVLPSPHPQEGIMGKLQDLMRHTTDDYDKLDWPAQAALSANPITNVPIALGQMDKYASMGDLKGMGITALGALLSPVKVAGIVGRGLLRSLSPVGIAANVADTAVELPDDKQAEWDALRAEQLNTERQNWLRAHPSVGGVRG